MRSIIRLLRKIKEWFKDRADYNISARISRLERNLKALQAIDMGWKERGKIIIIASVGGQDIIKIIDVEKEFTTMEYKALSERLEAEYGARATFFDVPNGGRQIAREIWGDLR